MKANSKSKTYLAKWRSDKAEQAYRQLEDAAWRRATDSLPDAIDVTTGFGQTRVYHWPGNGPAVVFLHGMGDLSLRWVPYAEKLTDMDVYAVDVMGDVGRSTPTVGFTAPSDYAIWLTDTMDALNLTTPHVVGESFGGYIALSYAIETGRVASTVGIDPVGVTKLRLASFTAWGFSAGLAGFTPDPVRKRLAGPLRQPLLLNKDDLKLYMTGYRNHPPKIPPQPLFTDDELASITTPVRVLAAGKSAAFDGEHMVERINTLVPKGEGRLLADAGHSLSMARFDDCLAIVQSAVELGHATP